MPENYPYAEKRALGEHLNYTFCGRVIHSSYEHLTFDVFLLLHVIRFVSEPCIAMESCFSKWKKYLKCNNKYYILSRRCEIVVRFTTARAYRLALPFFILFVESH